MRSKFDGSRISSDSLEDRLKKVLDSRNLEETKFRANHVYQWTVMFCDVSRFTKKADDIEDEFLNELTSDYREAVLNIIEAYDPPFIAPGDGPQFVICFDKPEHAADAAIKIQSVFKRWRSRTDGGQLFRPSIGLHCGDFVIVDDDLKQSNACNMGKRIETQAQSGQIFISSTAEDALETFSNYKIEFVRETMLKNIPEPQKVYSILWQESKPYSEETGAGRSAANEDGADEPALEEGVAVVEQFMGILVCDVAGSTRKFWNLGDREGNQLIEIFRKEVFMILKKYKAAHIEIREGDMIVACFNMDKPIVNVQAAVEIQKNFFTRNVNLGTRNREKLETSIGIHVGNIGIHNGQIVPTPDFFTSKGIQDLAEANEVCLSEEVAKLISEYSNLSMTEAGETTIKGIPEPIKIYLLEWYKKGQGNPLERKSYGTSATGLPLRR